MNLTGKKEIFRKARPQPPHYFWLDSDGCWDCNCKHHGCNGCKRLKQQKAAETAKRNRAEKLRLRTL